MTFARWVLGLCLVLGLTGCLHGMGHPEYPQYEHVFAKPVEVALDETRRLLVERGFDIDDERGAVDPRQFFTGWRGPMTWNSGDGTFTRYLVTGLAVSSRESVIRIFRIQVNGVGNDAEVRSQVSKDALRDEAEDGTSLRPAPNTLNIARKDLFRQRNRDGSYDMTEHFTGLDGAQYGLRDMELERALALRLESTPSIETLSGNVNEQVPVPVRTPEFYLTRWQDQVPDAPSGFSPKEESRVFGLEAVIHAGRMLLIGEQLGSAQVPAAVGVLVRQAAERGIPVALGLSIPSPEQPRIDHYLGSPGAPMDQDALLDGRFWRRPYQDGRSSRAIFDLIDQVRAMRAQGLKVSVVAYDTDLLNGGERDAALADVWLKRHAARPDEMQVVLAGNTHVRMVTGVPWDRDFTPMAQYLRQVKSLLVLEVGFAAGRRWGCDLDKSSKLQCGVVGATPTPRTQVPPLSQPYLKLYEKPTSEGYQGQLTVGRLTASQPAIDPVPRVHKREVPTGPIGPTRPPPYPPGY
ncbi:hypothetical protein KRR26_12380 [Corallococcus sp. M34]|uniref:hypothetical protein n=1 Tax=Citreicoccus inhibens TaxID=2849499 RepID=UPI001C245458|nr:hypothetical protein [Citreicoccus inhibens]MBU8896410.1 hypothetical protein [Citreicoccus inhibens]